jgi:hypothetical protein
LHQIDEERARDGAEVEVGCQRLPSGAETDGTRDEIWCPLGKLAAEMKEQLGPEFVLASRMGETIAPEVGDDCGDLALDARAVKLAATPFRGRSYSFHRDPARLDIGRGPLN